MRKQEIPNNILLRAEKRLKEIGFKKRIHYQAINMIIDTTEVVEALGGRIDWSEPHTAPPADR